MFSQFVTTTGENPVLPLDAPLGIFPVVSTVQASNTIATVNRDACTELRLALAGGAFPGAPVDTTNEERLALWALTMRARTDEAERLRETLRLSDRLVGLGTVPVFPLLVAIPVTVPLEILWGGASLSAVTLYFTTVFVMMTACLTAGLLLRGRTGVRAWRQLQEADALNAGRMASDLRRGDRRLSPALKALARMHKGDEARLLAEIGPADLVALRRLTSAIAMQPMHAPVTLSGEHRELVSRALGCLHGDEVHTPSFEPPAAMLASA